MSKDDKRKQFKSMTDFIEQDTPPQPDKQENLLCPKCFGEGVVRMEINKLLFEPCPLCGGKKDKQDWREKFLNYTKGLKKNKNGVIVEMGWVIENIITPLQQSNEALQKQLTEFKNETKYSHDDITFLHKERDDLKAENEQLKEGLKEIAFDHYPEDVFLPISKQEWADIHQMIEEKFNMPIDRLSAAYGRLLKKPVIDKANELLK